MLRTKDQNKQLYSALAKLSIDKERKEELVYRFTQGREISSSAMTVCECHSLIDHLNSFIKIGDKKNDVQRKKILSICHEMNWRTEAGQIDWKHLNEYLLKYGYLHKLLNNYTEKELPKLVTQFENLLKSYYEKR